MGDRARNAVYSGLAVWAKELQVIKESTLPQTRHAQVAARHVSAGQKDDIWRPTVTTHTTLNTFLSIALPEDHVPVGFRMQDLAPGCPELVEYLQLERSNSEFELRSLQFLPALTVQESSGHN